MSEKAYIAYQLKKLVEQLDRVPLQEEFCKLIPRWYIQKNFGTYNNLLKYCDLETNKENVGRKKKING